LSENALAQIPGAAELIAWFGGVPSFHDAVAAFTLRSDGTAEFVADGFRTTDQVDAKGYFVLDRHFRATFHLVGLRAVSLEGFEPGRIVLFGLAIERFPTGLKIDWSTSYGASGSLEAEQIRVTFVPGKHDG
jgi:hypothetical protein